MNISNHCFQRYHERVREAEGPFVDSLKERYTKELEELYAHCKKIYSGIIGHSTRPVDVYVNAHGWVLIANDKEQTLITVYKVDLGIENDLLNKQYIAASLKRIEDLENNMLETALKADEQKQEYLKAITANEALIKEYRQTISGLESSNDAYKTLIRTLDSTTYKSQADLRNAIQNYMIKDPLKIDINLD